MPAEELRDKWDLTYRQSGFSEPSPAEVLSENAHLMPDPGDALDLACGLGGNALFLARRGFRVTAWDISNVAIERISAWGAEIQAEARDVEAEPFPTEAFDVIVISRFLSRRLSGAIVESLKPGGLLFYQTFIREKPGSYGPSNPDYLLAENELLQLFGGLRLLYYREEAKVGNLNLGRRDEAYFIGQKR